MILPVWKGCASTAWRFREYVSMVETQFRDVASMGEAEFHGRANFRKAQFHGDASVGGARFHGPTHFGGARFGSGADLHAAHFTGSLDMTDALATSAAYLPRGWLLANKHDADELRPIVCRRPRKNPRRRPDISPLMAT